MSNPTMLYKLGGIYEVDGSEFDYVIVDEEEVESKLQEGWYLTTSEAKDESINSAPTRLELETKAKELEIQFDGRTSNKKLSLLIDAKLGGE